MINETRDNVKVRKTWQGYEISMGKYYIASVYGNKANLVTDYAHAKHYKSKAHAEALVMKIKEGGVRV